VTDLPLLDRVMTPGERRAMMRKGVLAKKRGHAATPGSGPANETCRSCKFLTGHFRKRAYYKCGRVEWTHGAATDIHCRDAACQFWEARR
jgi:hypothetical protein